MIKYVVLLTLLAVGPLCVWGHGMVMNPVNRASRWRFNDSAPQNWDDNQMYCGGLGTHWGINKGNCGSCGDSFSLAPPRPHELGGKYGEGVIVKSYSVGSTIPVTVRIIANHNGFFLFHLCNIDRFGIDSDECFYGNQLLLGNGDGQHPISYQMGDKTIEVRLPEGVSCNHCVLKWTYRAANNWGVCAGGITGPGCGPQETYVTCSDISIN